MADTAGPGEPIILALIVWSHHQTSAPEAFRELISSATTPVFYLPHPERFYSFGACLCSTTISLIYTRRATKDQDCSRGTLKHFEGREVHPLHHSKELRFAHH